MHAIALHVTVPSNVNVLSKKNFTDKMVKTLRDFCK